MSRRAVATVAAVVLVVALGVVLLGAAVVCILVPFIEQRTWHGPLRLALFPLAAVLLWRPSGLFGQQRT
jgi:branched-subunit amino acid ABC-type transport system permease component